MRYSIVLPALLCLTVAPQIALGADAYFNVPVSTLTLTEGSIPERAPETGLRKLDRQQAMHPYVHLDGAGEAYFDTPGDLRQRTFSARNGNVVGRAPQGQDVSGSLYAMKPDMSGMLRLRFKVPAADVSQTERQSYLTAKHRHYRRLVLRRIPGAAWYRHQTAELARQLQQQQDVGRPDFEEVRDRNFDRTYGLLSGGRAVSENLQLDRQLPTRESASRQPAVPLQSIRGITVAALDWKSRLKDAKPALDPLASVIPADQYALFFPSFGAAMSVLDEAELRGTPILRSFEPRAEDAGTKRRYERQLGLSLSVLGRLVGPQVAKSVALTGSDPYLRMGSAVTVLFEARDKDLLMKLLQAQIRLSAQGRPEARETKGKVGAVEYWSMVTPDRTLCAYLAKIGSAVVVTNSLTQLEACTKTQDEPATALNESLEYIFFRDRYRRGDAAESALLILTDAAIRQWCSPRWRIANSRRTRAASELSELQAVHIDAIARKFVEPIRIEASVSELGDVRLTPLGVISSVYGRLDWMTPIPDILGPDDKVTHDEAQGYERWRDTYQQNWRAFFDPIAVRLTVDRKRLAADTTVMPLIVGTEYGQMIELARGGVIGPGDGDPHDAAIHYIMALNPKSRMLRSGADLLNNMVPGANANPLSWLGGSIALFVDDDPFWKEAAAAKNSDEFFQKEYHRLPVAVVVAIKNKLGLAAFLVAIRGIANQTAPGMVTWESLEHNKHPYVKVAASAEGADQLGQISIYYSSTDAGLVISLNENVLKRSIDRSKARKATAKDGQPAGQSPWLGSSVGLQLTRQATEILDAVWNKGLQDRLQLRSWNNLPILNEWRKLYPQEDSLAFHERIWHVRLVDPAGGQYRWNNDWQTYESTAYGHPGEPKDGPSALMAVQDLARARFGLTFEEDGLRAKVELERTK